LAAAGLSTDWFGLGSGVVSTGFGWTSYNQAAYISNVQMRQAQAYQDKNYHLSWVAIARDDIRDMLGISVARINNYMLVATLILGVATEAILSADIHRAAPTFIVQAFWVSMGVSILHFALSIMFSVKGQNAAFLNTMRLLTWEVRPENPARYDHDYMQQAQQFEKDGLSALFRLPGLTARYHQRSSKRRRKQSEAAEEEPWQLGPQAHGYRGFQPEEPGEEERSELEKLNPISRQLLYLARFGNLMQLWQPFDTHARLCIGLGLVSLAQGAAYFCLGRLTPDLNGYNDVIACAMIVVFSYIIYAICQQSFHSPRRGVKPVVYGLFLSGPVAATVAAVFDDPAWIRRVFAPLCCFCHCALYLVAYFVSVLETKTPAEDTKKYTTGPDGQRFPENWRDCVTGKSSHAMDPLQDPPPCPTGASQERLTGQQSSGNSAFREDAEALAVHNSVAFAVRGSLILSALLWFGIFISAVIGQLEPASLQPSLPLETAEEVRVSWPAESIRPHALACSGTAVFAANRYQIFRIPADGGPAVVEPCPLDGTIQDITVVCDGQRRCWPWVLLEGEPKIVDCSTCRELPLLRERSPAHRISLRASDPAEPLNGTLLVKHGDEVVEYAWEERRQHCGAISSGWSPLWHKAKAEHAADFGFSDTRLYLFGSEKDGAAPAERAGVVRVHSLETEALVGKWKLPAGRAPPVAGCAAGVASGVGGTGTSASEAMVPMLLLLPEGRAPPLLRAVVP